MMQFYSTNNKNKKFSLEEAVMEGLAKDGGLFMPEHIPQVPESFLKNIHTLNFPDMCFQIAQNLLQDAIPLLKLREIIDKAMIFDAPVRELSAQIHSLELFHGPTLSFKDFGAQFMAQLMAYFIQDSKQTLHILVATSGDTGSAIAQAFLNVEGIRVWILYPKDKVSWSQEKQLTTMGHNITALEIDGTFDDCQRLVKQAFSDKRLRQKLSLTSANSINIARLIPQTFYYFYAYVQVTNRNAPLVFSVPSGNFGNLTAGLLAKKMGLPVHHFVAATNINDIVPKYLNTGKFEALPSKQTLSNAMDVGNPSNFSRMLDLFGNHENMREHIFACSFTDDQTKAAMKTVFEKYDYLMDPHGAVAYLGLEAYLVQHPGKVNGIFLETADPAKFADEVEKITGQKVEIPNRLATVLSKKKHAVTLAPDYEEFCSLLLKA